MAKLIDLLIRGYQAILSPILHQVVGSRGLCRFEESCSSYSRRVIREYGILSGIKLTVKRLLACQPFIHYG